MKTTLFSRTLQSRLVRDFFMETFSPFGIEQGRSEQERIIRSIAYMAQHPRPEGSKHIANVREELRSWLRGLGYPFVEQDVPCFKWSCLSGPSLTLSMGNTHGENQVPIPCFPIIGSGSTRLENNPYSAVYGKIGPRSKIISVDQSEWVGLPILLKGKPSGCTIISRKDGTWPVGVTDHDHAYIGVNYEILGILEAMKNHGKTIKVQVKTSLESIAAPNIIVGNRDAEMLIVAHLDSFPGSPGAEDNASGVAALMKVLSDLGPDNYCVGFTCGEETGMHGARALCEITNPKLVVCIDSVGIGELVVQTNMRDSLIIGYPHTFRADFGPYDLGEFTKNETPGVLITSRSPDGYYYPYAHRPTDTVGNINPDLVMQAAEVVKGIITSYPNLL